MRRITQVRGGFSLVEVLVVIAVLGIGLAVMVPRLRESPATQVRQAATQLTNDLELVRVRALATTSRARLVFETGTGGYTGYLDADRDGAFAESADETAALQSFRWRPLPDGVRFGRGNAPELPAFAGEGAVTFENERIDFDARGLTTPFGTQGVVYLVHERDDDAVAAVAISGAAAVRRWVYMGGNWR